MADRKSKRKILKSWTMDSEEFDFGSSILIESKKKDDFFLAPFYS